MAYAAICGIRLLILLIELGAEALACEGEDRVGLTFTCEGERAGDKGAGGKGFEGGGVGIEGVGGGVGIDGTDDGRIEGEVALLLGGEGKDGTQIAVGNAEAQGCHAHLYSEL